VTASPLGTGDDVDVDYLLAELARLDVLLRHHLAEWRATAGSDPTGEFRGLYVSDEEVDRLLRDGTDARSATSGTGEASDRATDGAAADRLADADAVLIQQLESRTRALRARRRRLADAGADRRPRFVELGERFGLDREHLDALLVGLAPAVDPKYERVYAYLQDDVTRRRPTVDLACRVLRSTPAGRLATRRLFGPSSPLVRHRLVRLSPGDGTPLGSRTVSVDDRVVAFLTGGDDLAAPLADAATVTRPAAGSDAGLAGLALERSVERTLARLVDRDRHDHRDRDRDRSDPGEPPLLTHFHGPYGARTAAAVEALCAEVGRPLVTVDARSLLEDVDGAVRLLVREARLQGRRTALHVRGVPLSGVDGAHRGSGTGGFASSPGSGGDEGVGRAGAGVASGVPDGAGVEARLLRALDGFDGRVFLTGRASLTDRRWRAVERHDVVAVAFPRPAYEHRKRLWERVDLPDGVDLDPADLATKFRLTAGEVDDALAAARRETRAAGRPLDAAAVYAACRAQSRGALGSLARKVEPTYGWDDIVLPAENRRHLREVAAHVGHRGTVYADWGFEERFSLGKGLLVLFTGPSGTGKTMAAEVLANDAGLDLYKVDLSQVVDRYVGETEKNLGRVFDGAAGSDAVLLFDEADALFGKRSEVRDAHDRYANVEVNYLLQRVEEHDGTVVLTTNLRKNMDEAFLRRIHLRVDFPFPDAPSRRAIWATIFPAATPVGDLDIEFLSTLSMAGGNIKNAALTAAFLAAEDGGPVEMRHVVRAVQREFQKTGTLVEPEAFGDYRELLGGGADDGPTDGSTGRTNGGSTHRTDGGSSDRTNGGSSRGTGGDAGRR
jgi:hypothetical protein